MISANRTEALSAIYEQHNSMADFAKSIQESTTLLYKVINRWSADGSAIRKVPRGTRTRKIVSKINELLAEQRCAA